jgi:GAF domain-containing protein
MALNTSLELDEVLDRILGQIQRVIPSYGAAVMLLEEGSLRLARHRGTARLLEAAAYLGSGLPLDEFPVLRRSCQDRKAVLVRDAAAEPEWRVMPGLEWVRSLLSVPLVSDGKAIGLIAQLSERSGFFTGESLDAVQAFAPHAVLAIQNAQLFREVRDRREQLQKLSRRLVGAQELERQFIARELHDEASNALTSLKVQLRLLERQAGTPSRR